MSAKQEILARVRTALADVPPRPAAEDVLIAWQFGRPVDVDGVLEVFAERVEDYKATVVRCSLDEVPDAVAAGVLATGAGSVVVPSGLEASWLDALRTAGLSVVSDEPDPLSSARLNEIDAVVTASSVGIAETGTIVLDHGAPDQGRRALSLVPDRHVCVIRVDQVVSGVPEAVAHLKASVLAGSPLTWISGPSATSDIELSRVEGVHGPRALYVVIAG